MRNRGGVNGGGDGAPSSASPASSASLKKKPGGGAGPPPLSVPLSPIDKGDGGGAEASSFVRRDADVDVDADDDVDIDGDDEGGTGAAAAGAGGGGADEGSGRRRRVAATTRGRRRGRSLRKLADDIAGRRGRAPLRWTEILAMHASAAFAYSHHNVGLADVQVAIMTVIALAGCVAPHLAASPSHQRRIVIASSMRAFVGGQSVIGSSRGGDDHDHDDGDYHAVRAGNYPWLLLLSATTGCVWRFVIDGPNVALLSGYAGRMGFATFVGMNAVMVTAYGPAGVVDWDRYYGGFVAVEPDDAGGIRHVGEAEDAPSSHTPPSSSHSSSSTSSRWRASWDWAEDEEAGYQAASYVLGRVARGRRGRHAGTARATTTIAHRRGRRCRLLLLPVIVASAPPKAPSSRQRRRARCVCPVEHARRVLRAAVRIARDRRCSTASR